MTYKEIEKKYPKDYEMRKLDKYRYRYPLGESYKDMIFRTEPVIVEMERLEFPVFIVSHQAVLRVLYAYLSGKKPEECTYIDVPLHTIIEITVTPYGMKETIHSFKKEVDVLFENELINLK
jgi:broad specificity phosphatase PhoE